MRMWSCGDGEVLLFCLCHFLGGDQNKLGFEAMYLRQASTLFSELGCAHPRSKNRGRGISIAQCQKGWLPAAKLKFLTLFAVFSFCL